MLDTTHNPAAMLPQQDTGHLSRFAPTPSGCRPCNQPQLKTVTETRGRKLGFRPKPRPPTAPPIIRPAWHVVASLPKAERTAHASLHRAGFEAYLPLLTVRRPDRSWHTGPLFSGYLFVKIDLSKPWHPVRSCPGVYSLLLSGEKPGTVAEADIRALQAGDAIRATPLPKSSCWAPGMACRLGKGHPIAGVDAVIAEVGPTKALLQVMMLGHLREVAVSLDCLQPRGDT